MKITLIPVLKDNYIFLGYDEKTLDAFVVDPALAEPVLEILSAENLNLKFILNTHHHDDHVGGNKLLQEKTGAKIIGYNGDYKRIPGINIKVKDKQEIEILEQKVLVTFTPGHTVGHIIYYFPEKKWLFCGDTLFMMGCGRLFEGTHKQMFNSLNKIKNLPLDTQIFCTHEYTLANGRFALTIYPGNKDIEDRMSNESKKRNNNLPTVPGSLELELKTNPFLIAKDLEEFTKFRQFKDRF